MSINNVNRFLNVEDSHLRVVSGNVYAQGLNVGGITVGAAHGLQSVTNVSNTTSSTVEFTNTETSLVTSGDINMLHSSNNAAIKLNSNVVTEFPRSKKLIKYPRVALTQNALNNGYAAEASTENDGTSNGQAYRLFDGIVNGERGYHSAAATYSSGSTYTGSASITDAYGIQHQGEWIKLQMPTADKIKLSGFSFSPRYVSTAEYHHRAPYKGVFLGSTDGTNWYPIHYFDNVTVPELTTVSRTFENTTNDYYNRIALVVYEVGPNATYGDVLNFAEMELYGLPEYDPDAHGTDVVVKSLPNVPNTDWLEVYYDGQDYTSTPATVTDNSGNNLTGTLNGGVGFDTGYKAFTFDGVDGYISNIQSGYTSSNTYTVSMWFNKTTNIQGSLFAYGTESASPTAIGMFYYGSPNNYLVSYISGNVRADTDFNASYLPLNEWNHAASVYSPEGVTLYINGIMVAKNTLVLSSWNNSITIPTSPHLTIGAQGDGTGTGVYSTTHFTGSIANFRLFKRVLTSDEIWQLYAYQKEYFGRGDLGMTLKAGRLGIGTSEPRAMLDVRGTIRFSLIISHRSITADATVTDLNYIPFSGIIYETSSGLHNDNYFTCPIKGVYQCIANILTDNANDYDGNHTWLVNGSETSPTSRGYALAGGGNNHKQATSHFYFELNAGDTVGVASAGTQIWYGSADHRHSAMSIRLITPT